MQTLTFLCFSPEKMRRREGGERRRVLATLSGSFQTLSFSRGFVSLQVGNRAGQREGERVLATLLSNFPITLFASPLWRRREWREGRRREGEYWSHSLELFQTLTSLLPPERMRGREAGEGRGVLITLSGSFQTLSLQALFLGGQGRGSIQTVSILESCLLGSGSNSLELFQTLTSPLFGEDEGREGGEGRGPHSLGLSKLCPLQSVLLAYRAEDEGEY